MNIFYKKGLKNVLFLALVLILWAGLSLGSGPIGYITLEVSGSGSIDPPAGTYEVWEYDGETADQMDLSALPDAGWQFSEWSGPVDDPNAPTTFITIEARSIRVTAQFSEIPGYDKPGDNDSGGSDTGCFVEILSIRQ